MNITKHNIDCNMSFGRKDPNCARCKELLNGAKPRQGWQGAYYAEKKRQETARSRAISAHFRNHEKCERENVVCTAFEW